MQLLQTSRGLIVGAATVVVILCILLLTTSYSHVESLRRFRARSDPVARFHLVLPATDPNDNFCKLLLSGAVNGYPDPIFVGWHGHGRYNGAESHLFKISETMEYFNSLPESADNDLALVLDAYDIWLTLRVDVMISRYYPLIQKLNQRLEEQGLLNVDGSGNKIYQSVIFGPDKTCWPGDGTRGACWAVPDSPMYQLAFGPDTDTWMVPNRPRWLNSGTIMGPVKDMRDMFQATMNNVERVFDEGFQHRTSDQFYFQNVWAEQEVSRMLVKDGYIEPSEHGGNEESIIPDLDDSRRAEFGITLDYNSNLFQTMAAYAEYLTFMSFNHSSHIEPKGYNIRLDQMTLPDDITNSPPPFPKNADDSVPKDKGWKDVMLGVDPVTQIVFPLLHMTGEKQFRDAWWSRLWFHPHGEALLRAAKRGKTKESDDVIAVVNGTQWYGARIKEDRLLSADPGAGHVFRGGAWSAQGEYVHWDAMCKDYEDMLFRPEAPL